MMMPSHKIKNTVFDLRFSSKSALLQENSSLGGFVQQRLMPVVDEVLSAHALEEHVIYLDKLKIDLGRIQFADYKGRMERRLRTKLDTLLKSKIRNLQHTSGAAERIVPLTKRNLQVIAHFLMTGTLPGSLNLKHGRGLEQRLQSILKQERSGFLRFLQKTSQRPQVIQRLVRQFSTGTVRLIAGLLASAQAQTIFSVVDDILLRSRSRSLTGEQTAAFTALVWELLLDYLLQNPKGRFSETKFVNWITTRAESHSAPATESLWTAFVEAAQGPPSLKTIASQPADPPKPILSKKETRRFFKGYDLYEALRFYLRHGMMPWSAGTIAPDISVTKIINEMRRSYPEKLLKIAKDLHNEPDLCRSLAQKLTPAVMKQLIMALSAVSSSGNDKDRLTFRQSITDYADRATDRKGYYAAILRSLVKRRPIDLKQIAARPDDPGKAEPRNAAFEPGQDPDMIRAYLTALLKSGRKAGAHDAAFAPLLEDLETKYPCQYRDYLAWQAANKKRFAPFLGLTGSLRLKKSLARLAGFTDAERYIELLEKVFSTEAPSKSSNRTAILRTLTRLIITTPFSDADAFLNSAIIQLAGLNKESKSESRVIETLEILMASAKKLPEEKIYLRLNNLRTAYQRQGNLESIIQKTPKINRSTVKPRKEDETALIKYLTAGPTPKSISDDTAGIIFRRLIRSGSETLYAAIRDHLKSKDLRKKMITLLPENWLIRVLADLRPDLHPPVQTYADIITEVGYSNEILEQPAEISKLKWEFIFAYVAANPNRSFRKADFIRRFIEFLGGRIREMDTAALTAILHRNLTADMQIKNRDEKLVAIQVLKHIESNSFLTRRLATSTSLAGSVSDDLGSNDAPWQGRGLSLSMAADLKGQPEGEVNPIASKDALKSEPTETLKIEHPASFWETAEDMLEEVALQNAGMVIAAPYLPQLWNMLGLVEADIFKNNQAAERAVHLLQFMTDKRMDSPEYELVLNKILCGVKASEPITGHIDISEKEQQAVEGLIQGMITNWKGIGQTSIEGFRESFLKRRGRLRLKDDAWHLKVEQRAFDMLLDSIPWGFATIKHPWMERVVYVEWR